MKIGLVGIFKNECEYILEWLSYHKNIIGFDGVIAIDNISTDGSSQLFEALEDSGQIDRVFYPRISTNLGPQIPAYNEVISRYKDVYDYLLFIDADEFLVNNTNKTLHELISEYEAFDDFGALTLNWRIFGSSGNTFKRHGLVIDRFSRASRHLESVNRHVKSLIKTSAIVKMNIHQPNLQSGLRCYDENKQKTVFLKNGITGGEVVEGDTSPFSKNICNKKLFIAHFAVKSKAEHFSKKASRGSAGGNSLHEKGRQYFISHDLNHEPCTDLQKHKLRVLKGIDELDEKLGSSSPYNSYLRAHIDNENDAFVGWIATDFSSPVVLKVLLDGAFEKELPLNVIRDDVFSKGISNTKLCGFRYSWKELGNYSKSISIYVKSGNLIIYEKSL